MKVLASKFSALSLGLLVSVSAFSETVRVSVTATGGELTSDSGWADISGNGRYVAYSSSADELGVNGGDDQSFLYDTETGSVTQVTFDYSGGQPNDPAMRPRINHDGSRVTFASYATDIVSDHVPGINGANGQVYLWSKDTNQIVRVSETAAGTQADGRSISPDINADGNIIVFESAATNLVSGDTNGLHDIFVKNMQDGSIERVSLGTGGAEANGASINPVISGDGRVVAFSSDATNLVSDTNNSTDVFVYDDYTQSVSRVSVSSSGTEANGDSWVVDVSANGRFVIFSSDASNLIAGDTEGYRDIFVHDRVNGTTVRASETAAGVGFAGASLSASISSDGRYVAFHSNSNSDREVPGGGSDVYRKDLETGDVQQWSIGLDDTSYGSSSGARIADAGDRIAFISQTTNLVSGDTNGLYDVFYATEPGITCSSQ